MRLLDWNCWKWKSKYDTEVMDIVIPEFDFQMQWNLGKDEMLLMINPDPVNQTGCIHTSPGLENR